MSEQEETTKDIFYVQESSKRKNECMNFVTQMPIKSVVCYFKERNVKYQFTDMKKKDPSKGEYNSVKQATVGYKPEIWKEWK